MGLLTNQRIKNQPTFHTIKMSPTKEIMGESVKHLCVIRKQCTTTYKKGEILNFLGFLRGKED